MCACRGCYLLFTPEGAGGNHFKAVPDRYLSFPEIQLTPSQWDGLQIPVSVAFFFVNSTIDRVAAFYPSPAGATESLLSLDVWDDIVGANPELATLLPDVEAILVRADRETSSVEVFLVPIDACYELVGASPAALAGIRRGQRGARSPRAVLLRRTRPGRDMTDSDFGFEVLDARAEPYAAVPTIMLRTRITEHTGATVHALALRCQIRIEPQRRRYEHEEEQRLVELFGEPNRWGDSLRPFLWTHVATTVTTFTGETEIDLPMTCTYDFEIASTKFLHSLDDGEVPLVLLFAGSAFTRNETGMNVAPVAWHADTTFRLPVAVWRQMMDVYFPNSGWVMLSRDVLDKLTQYKADARARELGPHRRAPPQGGGVSADRFAVAQRGRGRGALRGLCPVSLPGLGAEEPGPLAVRRARAAGPARSRAV